VELALIKLCYLSQALEITALPNGVAKKKLVEGTKAVAFKAIQPLSIPHRNAEVPAAEPPAPPQAAKLIIETTPPPAQKPAIVEDKPVAYQPADKKVGGNGKLSSLDVLRKKVAAENGQQAVADKPLEMTSLQVAWKKFIAYLKEDKRPAWQSFELAELHIKDPACFEVIVHNRINEKFIEMERKEAGEFLQKELCNRLLQFTIILIEAPKETTSTEAPLSARDQYIKLAEEYPLCEGTEGPVKAGVGLLAQHNSCSAIKVFSPQSFN
jgi:DNA polymerase-3 subunit gamma/tau